MAFNYNHLEDVDTSQNSEILKKFNDILEKNNFNANFKNSVVTVYNVSGVEVMNVDMMGSKKSLDIEKLTSGAYLVKVSNTENGYSNTVKFIK